MSTSRRHSCRFRLPWTATLALLFAGLSTPVARVQVPEAPVAGAATAPASEPTKESVEALLADVENNPALDQAGRVRLTEIYQQALRELENAKAHAAEASRSDQLAAEAPGLLASIRAELSSAAAEPEASPPADATLAQVEQSEKQAEADLLAAKKTLDDLQAENATRSDRRSVIPDQIAGLRQKLADVEDDLATPPPPDSDPLLAAARRVLQECQQVALKREIERYEKEIASYDARRELLPARRDRAQRRVAQAEKLVAAWQAKLTERRDQEARRVAEEARRRRLEATRKAPELKELAETNSKYTEESATLARDRDELDRVTKEREAKLAEIRAQFKLIRGRVKAAGFTAAAGVYLRREYSKLEDTGQYRRTRRLQAKRVSDAQIRLLELNDDRYGAGISDIPAHVRAVVDTIAPAPEDRAEMEEFARATLESQRDLLDALIRDYGSYQQKLLDGDRVTSTLIDANEEYRAYIEEHIFSVKSVEGSLVPSPIAAGEALAWLLNPSSWLSAGRNMVTGLADEPVRFSFYGLGLLLLLLSRRRLVRTLQAKGEDVRRLRTDSFAKTLWALVLTLLLAAHWPAILLLVAAALTQPMVSEEVAGAAAQGLEQIVLPLLLLAFLRQATRPRGLAEAHFNWVENSRRAIRRQLRWFTPTYLALLFLVTVMQPEDRWNDSLGRVAFSAAMVVLLLFLRGMFSPERPVLAAYIAKNPDNLVTRLQRIWLPLLMIVPLALLVLTAIGYHYTALAIHRRFLWSLELILALIFVGGLLLRWLFVARRQLALEKLRLRREAAKADEAAGGVARGASGEGAWLPSTAPEHVDIPAISGQTLELLRTALLVTMLAVMIGIWADLVPALGMLRRVEVWPQVRIVEVQEIGCYPVLEKNGGPAPATEKVEVATPGAEGTKPEAKFPAAPGGALAPGAKEGETAAATPQIVTLADVGLSILLLLATLVGAKNIPGLMEILLLKRLPLEPSARYAASTIARYAIIIVGLTLTLGAIGIGWSTVQWLAAALTFGLAFGLQEIFANFVSGLIMLFEQPVRVGDVVTVDGIDGKVSKIRMRATTITDWDNRELIVPNKDFITGKLVNWTLSDNITRVVIRVGIAYSSEPKKARELLVKIARECPFVMDDPKPSPIFREFGDSALLFDLRVYIASRDVWPQLIDQLHERIHQEFAAAGIEIAFPQLDLHVRSAPGLAERSAEPPEQQRS